MSEAMAEPDWLCTSCEGEHYDWEVGITRECPACLCRALIYIGPF
jgi:hypothetical protein